MTGTICPFCGAYSVRSCEFEGGEEGCPWDDLNNEPDLDPDYLREIRDGLAEIGKREAAEAEIARLRASEALAQGLLDEAIKQRDEARAELARLRHDHAYCVQSHNVQVENLKASRDAAEEKLKIQSKQWWDAQAAKDAAEALLRDAGEVIEKWSHDGHLQTFEDRERFRKAARTFLAKLSPAPEPVREDTYPDRVSMEPWPYSTLYAPGKDQTNADE